MSDVLYVYRIVNTANNKCYIGSTANPKVRRSAHFSALRKGFHFNNRLLIAWREYGENCFKWEIIEENISHQFIGIRESYWVTFYDSYQNGYNCTPNGGAGSARGRAWSYSSESTPCEMHD